MKNETPDLKRDTLDLKKRTPGLKKRTPGLRKESTDSEEWRLEPLVSGSGVPSRGNHVQNSYCAIGVQPWIGKPLVCGLGTPSLEGNGLRPISKVTDRSP